MPKRKPKDGEEPRDLNATNTAANLAPEVLQKILAYLDVNNPRKSDRYPGYFKQELYHIPLVCREWTGLGNSALYYRVYAPRQYHCRALLRTLQTDRRFGDLIRVLIFEPYYQYLVGPDRIIRNHDLRSMWVHSESHSRLSSEIIRRCPKLEDIFTFTPREGYHMNLALRSLPQTLRYLHLDANLCAYTQPLDIISELARVHMPHLTDLTLAQWYCHWGPVPPRAMGDTSPFPSLKALRFRKCSTPWPAIALLVSWAHRTLVELELAFMWHVDLFMPDIAFSPKQLDNIRTLLIPTNLSARASLKPFVALVELEVISNISSSWLLANLPSSLRTLKVLARSIDVEEGPFLSGRKIHHLVNAMAQKYPNLRKLHITVEFMRASRSKHSIDDWTVVAFCLATMWDSIAVQFTFRCEWPVTHFPTLSPSVPKLPVSNKKSARLGAVTKALGVLFSKLTNKDDAKS